MRIHVSRICCLVALLSVVAIAVPHAQQAPLTSPVLTPVPRVMWFSGAFRPADNARRARRERHRGGVSRA